MTSQPKSKKSNSKLSKWQPKTFSPKKPTKKKYPNWIGFDIETYGNKNKFLLCAFVDYKRGLKTVCHSIEEVRNFLNNHNLKKQNYKIVATNLAFDFLGTFGFNNDEISFIEKDGKFYKATYYQHKNKFKSIHFHDTLNYHPVSVEQLGEDLKLAKLKEPKAFKRIPKNKTEEEELIKYCIRDAEISCKFMYLYTDYCKKRGINPKITIASTAMEDFKTNYLKEEIKLEPEKHREVAFKGYCGGRTEPFRRGLFKNIAVYDFNSLYPSVMKEKQFPNPKSSKYTRRIQKEHIKKYEGVVYAKVYQPETFIPILPKRIEDENGKTKKLLFPTGVFWGYFTFAEIREAQKHTNLKILKLMEGVYYTQTKDYFSKYVTDKYKERMRLKKEGNSMQLMSKLMSNSLYGKFGEKYKENSKIIHEDKIGKKIIESYISIVQTEQKGYYRVIMEGVVKEHSFPIWSAYIASYARIKLHRAMRKHQNSLLYCDTDSIFISDKEKVKTSDKLGDLGFEYKTKKCLIVRPKVYAVDTKIKAKGVQKKLAWNEFVKLLSGTRIKEIKFAKLRTVINAKAHHKKGKLTINEIYTQQKQIDPEDTKREWGKPFKITEQQTSKPLCFNE